MAGTNQEQGKILIQGINGRQKWKKNKEMQKRGKSIKSREEMENEAADWKSRLSGDRVSANGESTFTGSTNPSQP